MNINYNNIYNNLINLTRNKDLYIGLKRADNFSDRLTFFLIHFAFFLKELKISENKEILQNIYDYNFRQLELSIREIGYGDQSVNKRMKDYINLFHSILSDIHFWDDLNNFEKTKILNSFLDDFKDISHLIEYFDDFCIKLKKKNLNYFTKSVSKH